MLQLDGSKASAEKKKRENWYGNSRQGKNSWEKHFANWRGMLNGTGAVKVEIERKLLSRFDKINRLL